MIPLTVATAPMLLRILKSVRVELTPLVHISAIFQQNSFAITGLQLVRFLIPTDYGDSAHCILRWYWQTGNSCDSHPLTSQKATDELKKWRSVDGCGIAITRMGSCGQQCPTPACRNEQFKNCVDIEITNPGHPPITTAPPPKPTMPTTQPTLPPDCERPNAALASKVDQALRSLAAIQKAPADVAEKIESAILILTEVCYFPLTPSFYQPFFNINEPTTFGRQNKCLWAYVDLLGVEWAHRNKLPIWQW